MIGSKNIISDSLCSACYFRSIAISPHKKAIIQLTEKCNLKCEHCFVSSTSQGNELSFEVIQKIILPHLIKTNVNKVTLTGGEPFVHKELLKIVDLLANNNIAISICTNASLVTEEFVCSIERHPSLHFNVSLDGFSNCSHGRFRGNEDPIFFQKIINNIILLGNKKLLNGILVTPNVYSNISEYESICSFAKKNNARYVLMNPLSKFGRGEGSLDKALKKSEMRKLRLVTEKYCSDDFEVVYIRFPNENKPLGDCVAGQIFYIFSDGDVAICPYMVFAAKSQDSRYAPEEFMLGNIFKDDFDLLKSLSIYSFPRESDDGICIQCKHKKCSKGCMAAKISNGLHLSDADEDLCPLISDKKE